MNARPENIYKVVAYKCHKCNNYHIGKNGKLLKDKEKVKLQNKHTKSLRDISKAKIKVVGWVDLSEIKY